MSRFWIWILVIGGIILVICFFYFAWKFVSIGIFFKHKDLAWHMMENITQNASMVVANGT